MEEKRGSKTKLIIAILLVVAIILLGVFAYARYTSTLDGMSASATVAKWSFKKDGFNTLARTDGVTVDKIAADKLAPGTSGNINVDINAEGTEVSVDYVVTIKDVTNKPTNLKFYSDASFKNEITAVDSKYSVSGSIAANAADKTISVPIYWKWAYNSTANSATDTADTTDGEAAKNMTFTVEAVGTQGNPQ